MKVQQIIRAILIGVGLALAGYGIFLLLGLDHFTLGKFSAGARDTSTVLLITLIGLALLLFGWLDPTGIKTKPDGSQADEV